MSLYVVVFEFRGDPTMTVLTDTEDRNAALTHAIAWLAKERRGYAAETAHVYRIESDLSGRKATARKGTSYAHSVR